MTVFKAFILFVKVFFAKQTNCNNVYSIANHSLFKKPSYRIQKDQLKDLLIGFKYLVKSILLIFNRQKNFEHLVKGECLIFDGDFNQKNNRLEYISNVTKYKKSELSYIALNRYTISKPIVKKIQLSLFVFFVSFLIMPFTFFSKNRALYALFLLTVVENILLVDLMKRNNKSYLFYFFPFENDANFSALLLMKNNIKVHKVPGPNSLFHNHKMFISDTVSFCSKFQLNQYEKIKVNWRVDSIQSWPLYGFKSLLPYLNKFEQHSNYKFNLGFISSGIWRREELKKIPIKRADFSSEKKLIEFIKNYCFSRKIKEIFIFLHPIEKNDQLTYENSISFYENEFSNIKCHFPKYEQESYESFDLVETTLAAHSSANLQRLFSGYKTLYALFDYELNMFKDSELENISFLDEKSLASSLDKVIKMSETKYFTDYKLYSYTYKEFSNYIN